MKAAYIESVGPAENIRFGDLPDPVIGSGDVLARVTAVTVNHIDLYIRSGAYPMPLPKPYIVGRDMIGIVEQVGDKVVGFTPGDRVWSNCLGVDGLQGTFAELVAAPQDRLYRLPDGVDPVTAVANFHSALTAILGLFNKAHLTAGDAVFINGGSGNVGLAVLQIAKACGARVAVTAGSPEKVEWCRQMGADCVIDYHRENIVEALHAFAPQGVDIYWEAARGLDMEQALASLARGGRIVVISGLDRHCDLPVGKFYTRNASLHGFTVTGTTVEQLSNCARQINGWLSAGVLRAKIHSTLPLAEAAAAHRLQEQAGLFGKVVLLPSARQG